MSKSSSVEAKGLGVDVLTPAELTRIEKLGITPEVFFDLSKDGMTLDDLEEANEMGFGIAESFEDSAETDEEVFESYLNDLDLRPEELEGKVILDVGCSEAQFASEVKKRNIGAWVHSVDPVDPRRYGGSFREKKGVVFAEAEALPYKDGCMDLVVSSNAVPRVSVEEIIRDPADVDREEALAEQELERRIGQSEKKVREQLAEMLRVTKKGGEVRFAPVYFEGYSDGTMDEFDHIYNQALYRVIQSWEDKGVVTCEQIPRDNRVVDEDDGKPNLEVRVYMYKLKKLK